MCMSVVLTQFHGGAGMGKTHLCGLLQQQGVPMGQLEVLHGDVLDKTQVRAGGACNQDMKEAR